MKKNLIIVLSIIYFLFVNSSYFWEKLPGLWDMVLTGILFLSFVILAIILIFQIIKMIRNKFSSKITIINCIILTTVLTVTALYPLGIVDFRKFEGIDLILAQYEGAANCTTTLKIKKENRFIQRRICFGIDEYYGNYRIDGDTIKLHYDEKSSFGSKYAYGLIKLDSIKNDKNYGLILYYRDSVDNDPLPMRILEYRIK